MPIKATDHAGLTDLMKNMESVSTKVSCGHILKTGEGSRRWGDEDVCQDCYFDNLGELVEQHPVGRPAPSGRC